MRYYYNIRFRFHPLVQLLERRDVPSFLVPETFPAGSLPLDVVSADFNGDGKLDVAVANNVAPGMVSVLLNDGNGGLQPFKSFPTGGTGPSSLAVAEVSGDGNLDLLVTNSNSGTVAVIRGSGTGAFRRPLTYAAGAFPTSIDLADFNNDGKLDIVVAGYGSNNVNLLLGAGGGVFQPFTSKNIGTTIRAVTPGDFNGDGKVDLAAVGYDTAGNGKFRVLKGNGNGTFTLGAVFNATTPEDVVTGDFNGDGKLDVAALGSDLGIWLGMGNANFQFTETLPVDGTRIVASDVNNDGKLDLVLADPTDALVEVLIGRGDGSFQPSVAYSAGNSSAAVRPGDLTGDGIVDLAVTNFVTNGGAVTIVTGVGNGTFAPPTFAAGTAPIAMSAADLNADGDPDLVVADHVGGQNTLSLLYGGPGASVQSSTSYYVGTFPSAVAVAEFGGDDAPDLAVAIEGGPGSVAVILGNGNSSLVVAPQYPAGVNPFVSTAADLNNDGAQDLVVVSALDLSGNGGGVSVLMGNGNGTFKAPVLYVPGTNTFDVAIADLNGNGIVDLAIANNIEPSTVTILLGTGGGAFAAPQTFPTGQFPFEVVVGDFNGDAKPDLATASHGPEGTNNGNVSVLLGNGNGTFKPYLDYQVDEGPHAVAVGDLNNDGKQDLVTANHPSVSLLLGNGNGTFKPAVHLSTGPFASDVSVVDLNGDGKKDLAVLIHFVVDNIAVFLGNGNGTFKPKVTYPIGSDDTIHAEVADFDGNGRLDIATSNGGVAVEKSPSVGLLRGRGDGTFEPVVYYLAGVQPSDVTAADFTGDGLPDLAIPNYGLNGTVSTLISTGEGFAAAVGYAAGTAPSGVTAADFNGDGLNDVAVTNNNTSGQIHVLLALGDGVFQPALVYTVGPEPTAIAAEDFNLDGKLDLILASSGSGSLNVLLGNGDGSFQATAVFPAGMTPFALVIGNFDPDGFLDVAVANDLSVGTVTVLRGRGDGTFLPPISYLVGAEPTSIAAGDVNGDGNVDLAVANSAEDTVSVLLGNGDTTFQSAVAYATGPDPIAVAMADFNADGWLDIAVAQSNGVMLLVNAADWPPVPILGIGRRLESVQLPDGISKRRSSLPVESARPTIDFANELDAGALSLTMPPSPRAVGTTVRSVSRSVPAHKAVEDLLGLSILSAQPM